MIDLIFSKLYHVRAVTQGKIIVGIKGFPLKSLCFFLGDVLHVDPNIIPTIFQIIYDSQAHTLSNLVSVLGIHSQVCSPIKFHHENNSCAFSLGTRTS